MKSRDGLLGGSDEVLVGLGLVLALGNLVQLPKVSVCLLCDSDYQDLPLHRSQTIVLSWPSDPFN
jgi:hypothetical protein